MGETQIKDFYAKIGQLIIERDFFSQGLRSLSSERRKGMVESNHSQGLSIARQCERLGISRSSSYYEAKGDSPLNLKLMRMIDETIFRDALAWLPPDGPLATAGGRAGGTATFILSP